ncbi:OmpA family protein [Pedobacter sp. GR22-6]|uniref:OmpA family protein n=1 Tax=Pedobacter sp. GR22-6 TaxID=3127957 RepID=UPI00307F46FD
MKIFRTSFLLAAIVLLAITFQSCKTKKVIAKPTPTVQKEAAPVEEKTPSVPIEKKEEAAPVEEKPDYSFTNVLFEFDSGVLKTGSFEVLDRMAREMKKDLTAKFILNGHSSQEGSAAHNMSLSVDRANSVKSYLINAGVPAANLTVKGYGATKPVASNDNETGRAQNRRVEFKLNP